MEHTLANAAVKMALDAVVLVLTMLALRVYPSANETRQRFVVTLIVVGILVLVLNLLPDFQNWNNWKERFGGSLLAVSLAVWTVMVAAVWMKTTETLKCLKELAGPPQMMVINGQSVKVPYKFANVAALSDALEGIQNRLQKPHTYEEHVAGVQKQLSDLAKWYEELKGQTRWKTNANGKVVGVEPLKYPNVDRLNNAIEELEEAVGELTRKRS